MSDVTLTDVLEGKAVLSRAQKHVFLHMFTRHCCEDTKRRILSVLENPTGLSTHDLYDQVTFQEGGCKYRSRGMAAPPEMIANIRKLLLKG